MQANILKSPAALFLMRLFAGLIFAYSGFLKVLEPVENFRAVILDYQVFPYDWTLPAAYVIPWLELIGGVFLVAGFLPRQSALLIAVLSGSFAALIFISWIKTGTFPENCGCFGDGGIQLKPYQVILLDITNVLIGLKLFRTQSHPFSLDQALK